MKRELVVGTVLSIGLALTPASAALAGATGNGNAHGNCQNSSAGGVHEPLPGSAGNGNGGHRKGETCDRPGGGGGGGGFDPVDPGPVNGNT